MTVKQNVIRKARAEDNNQIYTLHIESIKYYCSGFYSENALNSWIKSKSPEAYNRSSDEIIIVAEENNKILGFAWLNIKKKNLDGLYIAPKFSGKGYGKLLLKNVEKIAHSKNIEVLNLSSTLNAVKFYHHMGYQGTIKSTEKLKSGIELDCIKMKKEI